MGRVDGTEGDGDASGDSLEARSRPWLVRLVALVVGVVVVALGLALLGGGSGGGVADPPPTPAGLVSPGLSGSSAAGSSGPAAADPSGPTGPTTTARVTRVVDGDTIIVKIGGRSVRVRYIGMDTPESVKPDTPVQPMAEEATAANRDLVEGREVVLERDVSETDRYGRLLRNVWVRRDGRLVLVGLELVRQGYAQVTTFPPDVKYVDDLLAAQRQARDAGVGLWAGG